MTRAALAKLLILVILTFIICLPEFFSVNRVSKVNFHCVPYRQCKRRNQVRTSQNGKIEDAGIKSKDECDPSQSTEQERWEKTCAQWNQNDTADRAPDSRRVSDDVEESWFMCQTDMDMAGLHRNMSSSGALKVHVEVSVELHLCRAESMNLTLYGYSNNTTLDVHSPEEQKEEEEEAAAEGLKAFYCCLSVLPTSESDSRSHCLLWLANQTLSTVTAKEQLQWTRTQTDEWQSTVRQLWLALVCVVLLTIVTVVIRNTYLGIQSCREATVRPQTNVTVRQLNACDTNTETLLAKVHHFYSSHPCSELSPIEEAHSQEDAETLLDGNVNHRSNANLDHHGHPPSSSSSSVREEQQNMDFK